MKRLAEEFGPEWAMQHIVPQVCLCFTRISVYLLIRVNQCFFFINLQVLEMISNPHYLYRMTILRAVSLLAPVMGSEITCSKLLPVVMTGAKDRQVLIVN